MARRKTKRKRRSPKLFSILDAAQAYAFANLLTMGSTGTSPVEFVTGKYDLGTKTTSTIDVGLGVSSGSMTTLVGATAISLADIVNQPTLAFDQISANVRQNWQAMAIGAVATQVSFKLFRRLMRQPINNVNRTIMKPLGVGIKL